MINLIPPTAKKRIVLEYWLRVLTVWLALCVVAALFGLLIMLPTYVLVRGQVDAYKGSAAEASAKIADYEGVAKSLVSASQNAKTVLDTIKTEQISTHLELFDRLESEDLVLTDVLVTRGVDGFEPISLKGTAINRQAIANFRDRLLSEPTVESVDFPISSLAKDRDIPFTMTVVLKTPPTP
jgi:hypothetical protein